MAIIRSRNGVPLRLTKERWGHIARRHPEMRTQKARVIETVTEQENLMEALRILDTPDMLSWEYDEDGDVLYISVGEPRPAVTVDLGESVLARYDENEQKLVGITILNVGKRLAEGLSAGERS